MTTLDGFFISQSSDASKEEQQKALNSLNDQGAPTTLLEHISYAAYSAKLEAAPNNYDQHLWVVALARISAGLDNQDDVQRLSEYLAKIHTPNTNSESVDYCLGYVLGQSIVRHPNSYSFLDALVGINGQRKSTEKGALLGALDGMKFPYKPLHNTALFNEYSKNWGNDCSKIKETLQRHFDSISTDLPSDVAPTSSSPCVIFGRGLFCRHPEFINSVNKILVKDLQEKSAVTMRNLIDVGGGSFRT